MSTQKSLFDLFEFPQVAFESVATEETTQIEEISPTETKQQTTLFDIEPRWKEMWTNMPSFEQQDMRAFQSVTVHFRNESDRNEFSSLINQRLTSQTQYVWWPVLTTKEYVKRRWKSDLTKQPKYPVYVISKGRWESRLTARALDKMHVNYRIVIEPQELEQYASVIDRDKIVTLPFSNLGQGSIPARNWVWEHSLSIGAERHWIVDDNIAGFIRQHQNQRISLESASGLIAMEHFADRYENVALAGPNYRFFATTRDPKVPPFYRNTRVYSCILIKNDLPYRWRGRYNEDTDLSLRALKDGWCTVLFNAIKINKQATMTMKGGNTDELYADDGRLKMAESLRDQHPDCVRITRKWNRWQHHVDYSRFKDNAFIEKKNHTISDFNFDEELQLIEEREH